VLYLYVIILNRFCWVLLPW